MSASARTAWDDLAAALIVFAVFAWEFVVLLFIDPLFPTGSAVISHQLITAAGWAVGASLIAVRARRADLFADRKAAPGPLALRTVIVVVAIVLAIAVRAMTFGEPKIVGEFDGITPLAAVVLLAYYLSEASLILLLIRFAQRAGETRTGTRLVPWGGIALGLTWGVMHLFLQGISGGLYAIFAALLYGLVVVHGPRNVVAAGALVALAFIV